ncbi:polysaccharide lyase family 8 super-sandwich domain-containing protein [Cytophaga aurantiaca]|uniref:polysaccharide lyase family 8 super-sandwich domain-containing protein n=1 Tax=Cytophaga aurantiaca TaxID=29530 RepID=UPI00036D1676|nr:polysaccharide lyase family 8 super-sandwich domain-containing protein [Cytophaga aurantiaca]
MTKLTCLLIFFVYCIVFNLQAQTPTAADYEITAQRVQADILTENPVLADTEISKILGWVRTQNTSLGDLTKPYFSDIDYTSDYNQKLNTIPYRVQFHFYRILQLAVAYTNGSSTYKNNPAVLNAIIGALEYYYVNKATLDNYNTHTNYTYPFLDFPGYYTQALILLRNNATMKPLLAKYAGMTPNRTHDSDYAMSHYVGQNLPLTGANLSYNGTNVFRAGIVLKNQIWVTDGLNAIASFVNKNAYDDGVLVDQSFYAHHQVYNSGYGWGGEETVIQYCDKYIKGTDFVCNFSIQQIGDYLLNGQYWFQYRKAYDFQTKGRNFLRIGDEHIQLIGNSTIDYMVTADAGRASEYLAYKNHTLNGAASTRTGHKQFFKANIDVQRTANSYMSVKFPSNRCFSIERGNMQGIKLYNLSLGGTIIMADGSEFMRPDRVIPSSNSQYLKGEMISIMNYSLFPGTTTKYSSTGVVPSIGPEVNNSNFYHMKGENTFGGGLNNGNSTTFVGTGGISAFIQDKAGIYDNGGGNNPPQKLYVDQLVKAQKAYFFIGDAMFCMGNSISSTDNNIVTTVNQHLTAGAVTINTGSTSTFSSTQQTFAGNLKWAHHDQIGYLFPQNKNIVIKNDLQTGFYTWNAKFGNQVPTSSDQLAGDNVFSVWIEHGNAPTNETYQYVVIPNISAVDLAARSANFSNEFSDITNTSNIQAVRSIKNNVYACVFYVAGSFVFGDGLSVTVDKPALVYVEKNNNGYAVSVSDPLYIDNNTIKVQLNKLLSGPDAIAYTYSTIITAAMPTGDYVGSSITNQYNYKQATITPSGVTTFCAGNNVVLTANTGKSYIWKNGTTQVGMGSSYTAATSGSYTVQVTFADNSVSTSSATVITVNALPTATITANGATTFCKGGSVTLTASTGSSYIWKNGTTTVGTAATFNATTAGSYTVEVTNAAGCKATSNTTTVTVNAAPTANITANGTTTFCNGGSVTLTASTAANYIWKNGTTTVGTAATFNATAAGSYTVEVTNAAGCKATSSATTVTVNAAPTANITANGATTFCNGGSVTLTASTGASYIWKNGTTTVGTSSTFNATAAGSYTVEVTNAAGCKATSSATTVTVNTAPTANITAKGATTFCNGGSVTLTASSGASYIWKNGTTTVGTSSTFNATAAGSYTVEVTNAAGCKATSSATTVTVNAAPTANITANGATTFCQGGSVTLTASTGSSYIWKNGMTTVGTAATFNATTAGSYTVEVTNAAGCKATAAAAIIITVTSSVIWYADGDGDGKGDPNVIESSCTQPTGYISIAGDACPMDANKIQPGNCGCGNTEQSCLDCAGVAHGTAALDVCNICSGGTTGRTPVLDVNQCNVTTGIDDASSLNKIIVVPNPFRDELLLTIPAGSKVEIIDLNGRLVYEGADISTIETSDFSTGLYIVRILNESGVKVIKVEKVN